MAKKYSFIKILSEYNTKNKTKYHVSGDSVSKPTLTYLDNSVFYITYMEMGYCSLRKKSLYDFIYYHVRPCRQSLSSQIADMIRQKEEGKLILELKILPPNKIRYAYLRANSFSGGGNLGVSCMRGKESQKSLNFYVKNNVQIVVVIDNNNKIHARALLWENVRSVECKNTFTFTYLDRVYARSDSLVEQFYTLAKENKWKYYSSTSAGKAKQTYYIRDISIKDICHLPYTDTFRFLFYKDNLISSAISYKITAKVKHQDSVVHLTHTASEGYAPELDANRVQEVFTKTFISKKDAIKIKRYDGYVLKKNIADMNGDYYSRYDNKITETKLDGFIFKENAVSEVFSNEKIDKTIAVHSPKHNGYIHKSNVVCIKDEIYHTKDTDIVCFNSKWYHISECFIQDEKLIPKMLAVIMYDLKENPITGELEYKEHYYKLRGSKGLYLDVKCRNHYSYDNVYICLTSENRKHLKKFNGKYYIKQEFEAPSIKQLTFTFKE